MARRTPETKKVKPLTENVLKLAHGHELTVVVIGLSPGSRILQPINDIGPHTGPEVIAAGTIEGLRGLRLRAYSPAAAAACAPG